MCTPGASLGTRIIDCCWCFGAAGSRLAHEDQDPAARIAGAGRPPLAAVDHVVVAVAHDRALDVGRIRRRDVRLGHRERRTDRARQQRLEPLPLLLRRAVALQHFHVAGVGRRAVEDLGREAATRPMISHSGAYSRLVEPRAARRLRQEQIPQPGAPSRAASAPRRRARLPAVAGGRPAPRSNALSFG